MSESANAIAEKAINAALAGAKSADSKAISKGGGWMSAIAEAMGKAMGMQAARLVGLSSAIADNVANRDFTSSLSGDNAKGVDPEKIKADAQAAAVGQQLNAQFQATSQELSTSSNAFATAIKALGEASTTLARKG